MPDITLTVPFPMSDKQYIVQVTAQVKEGCSQTQCEFCRRTFNNSSTEGLIHKSSVDSIYSGLDDEFVMPNSEMWKFAEQAVTGYLNGKAICSICPPRINLSF